MVYKSYTVKHHEAKAFYIEVTYEFYVQAIPQNIFKWSIGDKKVWMTSSILDESYKCANATSESLGTLFIHVLSTFYTQCKGI